MHFSHQKALDVGDSLYLFTAGRVGGIFFKMLFLSQMDSRPLARVGSWPVSLLQRLWEKGWGGQAGPSPKSFPGQLCWLPPRKKETKPRKRPIPWALETGSAAQLPHQLPPPPPSYPLLSPRPGPAPPTSWALQPSLPLCEVLSYSPGLPIVNKTQVCSASSLQLILSGDAPLTTGRLNSVTVGGPRGWPTRAGPRGRSAPCSNSSLANSSPSSPPPAPDPGAAEAQPPHL